MRTLLNCVEVSISIYIQLERYGNILMDQQQKILLMPPYHIAWITVTAYCMEQNKPTLIDCCAARLMQPWLYLNGASLTILHLCWEISIGFTWSTGSVMKFCYPPTRHWMAMLRNTSQHQYQIMYHPGPSIRRINISSTHQDGGLKHLESEFSPR